MLRNLIMIALVAMSPAALAHSDSKFHTGPNGGHLIDAGNGAQHWELVAKGGTLILHITDGAEKPIDISGGSATAKILIGGKVHDVSFAPSGDNTMMASGDFEATKGMKVIVKTEGVGGNSFQARLTPLQ